MRTLKVSLVIDSRQMEFSWTFFAADFLARTSAAAASEREYQGPDQDFGEITRDSFAKYDPNTSSWKTWQTSLFEAWEPFSETWPNCGTMRNGKVFPARPVALRISERGFGLLPTPRRSGQARAWKAYVREEARGNLEEVLGELGFSGWITRRFVEWMMGYDLNWTDTRPSETQ
jgi:hypothetical protein